MHTSVHWYIVIDLITKICITYAKISDLPDPQNKDATKCIFGTEIWLVPDLSERKVELTESARSPL